MDARVPPSEGSIYTFYSYKGGVGRTMALANVAWLLASWNYEVLCIDWDLEAPGLPRYFPDASAPESHGLLDFIEQVEWGNGLDWRRYARPVQMRGIGERLHVIPAGNVDAAYTERVQQLDWKRLYRENDFGTVVETLRQEWKSTYDFVLIDSRTGVTDVGGICTVQAPDAVVALLSANNQNLEGLVGVLSRANDSRDELPFDRARLPVLPVITRLEATVEVDLTRQWFERISDQLTPFLEDWGHRDVSVEDVLTHTRIPHVARWSFGEELPVFREGTSDPLSIGYAYETLAALIANDLDNTQLLVSNRQAYVESATRKGAMGAGEVSFEYDVFVSFQRADEDFAMALADRLDETGLRVYRDRPEVAASLRSSEQLESSRNLVPVLSQQPTHWAAEEFRQFLVRTLAGDRPGAIVPVTRSAARDVLPPVLAQFLFVDAGRHRSPDDVAREVAVRLRDQDVAWYQHRYGADHPEVAALERQYAQLIDSDPFIRSPDDDLDDDEALRRLINAHNRASRRYGPTDDRSLEALEQLALQQFRMGNLERAINNQENVVAGYGETHPKSARALEQLAIMVRTRGDFGAAESLQRRARELRSR